MSTAVSGLSVEELTREYQARIAQAALGQYRNEDLVADWWKHVQGGLVEATRKDWRRLMRRYVEWLGTKRLHVLSVSLGEAREYSAWVEAGNYSDRRSESPPRPAVVLNLVVVVGLFYAYLRDVRGLVLTNPFPDVYRTFKKHHRSELHPDLRALDEKEAGLALEGADTLDDFTMVLTLFKTGVRREEYVQMQEPHINWKKRFIAIAPHPKRTFLKAYFDEELEHFLRLKVQRNHEQYPGNPYLSPSPLKPMQPVDACTVTYTVKKVVRNSPLGKLITDWKDPQQNATAHTWRRSFTSVLKRHGCPSHVVAVLRGDSLLHRSELIPDPTQGFYTKFGKVDGKEELRYWYDKCMPYVGAREIWERLTPRSVDTQSVAELIRATGRHVQGG